VHYSKSLADDQLFSRISRNALLMFLLLKPLLLQVHSAQYSYNLRGRRHNIVLIEKNSQLSRRHFIIRQLNNILTDCSHVYDGLLLSCVLTTFIKRILYYIVI